MKRWPKVIGEERNATETHYCRSQRKFINEKWFDTGLVGAFVHYVSKMLKIHQ